MGEVRYGHGGTAVPLSPVGAARSGASGPCAVSGGLDSMCLLDLLDRWCRKRDGRVVAAHFNHRLRGAEADRDETFVRDWCAAHDIAFVSSSGDVRGLMEREGLSLEEAARRLRYDFLRQEAEKLGQYIKIYTAHHADDNAGDHSFQPDPGHRRGGPYRHGLPAKRHLPPLLDVTREELAAYAAARHIPMWRTPPTPTPAPRPETSSGWRSCPA